MRRFLLSALVILAAMGLLGSTFAYFDDAEVSTGNSFEVGTWALDGGTGTLTVANPDAGDNGTETWTVTNVGSVPGYVDLNISLAVTGNLSSYLLVHLFVQDNGDIYGSAASPAAISGIAGSYNLNLPLEPGGSSDITLNWSVSDEYTPDVYDSVELTIVFDIKPVP